PCFGAQRGVSAMLACAASVVTALVPTTRGLRPPRVLRRGAARGPEGGAVWPVSHPPHTPSVPRDRDRSGRHPHRPGGPRQDRPVVPLRPSACVRPCVLCSFPARPTPSSMPHGSAAYQQGWVPLPV